MRVLWLSATPALGAERLGAPASLVGGWIAALQRALAEHGGVELAVAFPWPVPRSRAIEEDGALYLPYPRYPRGGRLRRLVSDLSCRLEPAGELGHLDRVVELSRPDLVHVWGTEAFHGLIAERRPELPVLIELQGLRVACSEVYLDAFGKLDLLRFGSPGRLLAGSSLLHRYYRYRRSAERERRILAVARFVCGRTGWDRTMSAALAPTARYFHCDRVLRPPFYRAEWRRRRQGPLRLVSVARGNTYKGLEVVARAAGLLERLLDGGFEWTIVGVRPGEEIQRIVERKLGVSLARRLRLVGRQSAEEVVRHLLRSDLFVLSSRVENSPNSLCEAMLLGLPIVATHVGGVPSLLAANGEGLLVPAGDPWAMAGAVVRLADQPELARRLGAAARRRAHARHEPTAVAAALTGIYRELLAATAGAAAAPTR